MPLCVTVILTNLFGGDREHASRVGAGSCVLGETGGGAGVGLMIGGGMAQAGWGLGGPMVIGVRGSPQSDGTEHAGGTSLISLGVGIREHAGFGTRIGCDAFY